MAKPQLSLNDYRRRITLGSTDCTIYDIGVFDRAGFGSISRYPYSIRILLENVLRQYSRGMADEADLENLASWQPDRQVAAAIPFMPARVILQDFTGVPALVDLAAMRSAVARAGGDPEAMNPFIPADLVIDHSIQVDRFGGADAFRHNVEREMERNRERYLMLRWGQKAFRNFRVVPPGTGIVHQVNLEYLASVVYQGDIDGAATAYPDTVLGTDSHTTMINGIGVMGWGVGGIEAEAVLLGQPYSLQIPEVVGVRLVGALPRGATATDLVLTVTQFLREQGVVGRFVEFFGPGLGGLSLPDRATIGNMAPEYGATMGFFPVDAETIRYLLASGRSSEAAAVVEGYCRAQRLFIEPGGEEPGYSVLYEIDLASVEPSTAGPSRPQDRLGLGKVRADFHSRFGDRLTERPDHARLGNGSVVIAAITSCTNTSNPDVMIGAALLARKAVDRGLRTRPWVKTSMAPGSRVVTSYLEKSGLLPSLETLGFQVVGYGCTTCIGNSGPLDQEVAEAIDTRRLVTASVLSGNRNFEARIHPQVLANYLASPPLVVAYALAGTVDIDLDTEPLGEGADGAPVMLRDIWPTPEEIREVVGRTITPQLFTESYSDVFEGDAQWNSLGDTAGSLYDWDPDSSYIREPPFFTGLAAEPPPLRPIRDARILALFGDMITTDHISPAGAIAPDSPAGKYLQGLGIAPADFNSYGSRRGNHEVMMRGTFANIRIRNRMVEREGGYTKYMPEGIEMSIYGAAMRYQETDTPLVVLAGSAYGTGSSRDWAAKGTMLLGVRAVIATSFERIHRSNLVGMGVLPLEFTRGDSAEGLGLDGSETITVEGLSTGLVPGGELTVRAGRSDGSTVEFPVLVRVDNAMEADYYRHGGILNKVLREILAA